MKFTKSSFVGVAVVLSLGLQGRAAVIPTDSTSPAMNGFTVSSSDLTQNLSSALTGAPVAVGFVAYNDGTGNSNLAALGNGSDGSASKKSVETAVEAANIAAVGP